MNFENLLAYYGDGHNFQHNKNIKFESCYKDINEKMK